MNISQTATALGISRPMVRKYQRRGMPTDTEESARAWLKKNSGGRFADRGSAADGTSSGTPGGTRRGGTSGGTHRGTRHPPKVKVAGAAADDDLENLSQAELSRRYVAARIRLTQKDEALKALRERQAQLDADLRDGKLLRAEDEYRRNFERAVVLRTKFLALPSEWAIQLAAMSDPALVADFTRKRIKAALIDYCAAFGVCAEPEGAPQLERPPPEPAAA